MIQSYASYTLINLANIGFSVILMVFLVNKLSPEDYSALAVYGAFFSLAIVVINFGHKELFFKCSSKRQEKELLYNFASASKLMIAGVVCFLLIGLFSLEAMLAAFYLLSMHLLQVVAAINRGYGLVFKDAGAILFYRVAWLLLSVSFFYFFDKALSVSHVFIAGIVSAVLMVLLMAKLEWLSARGIAESPPQKKKRFETLRRFFAIELLTTAYMKADVMLLKIADFDAVNISGYYLSVQLLEAALLLMAPLAYLFFNLANQALRRKGEFNLLKPVLITSLISTLGVLLWVIIGKWVMSEFFLKYVDAFDLSVLILCIAIPASINMVLSYQVVVRNMENSYLIVMLTGVVIMVLMTFALESAYSFYAPALGKLISEIIMLCAFLYLLIVKRGNHTLV